MAPEFRFAVTDDPGEWDALVAQHAGATGFHDWSWLQLMADVFGWRFIPLVVARQGTPVGVFPVVLRPGPIARPADPPFPYVGPLVPGALLPDVLRAFRRWQVRHGVPIARFDLGPAVTPPDELLSRCGVEWTGDRTYVVDLADSPSPEQLLAGMSRSARHNVRAAERRGVEIRPSLPGEVTAFLPRVLSESYESRGVPSPYPDDIGARIERWAEGRDHVYAATAVVEGELAGVILALAGHPVVMGWAGGTLRAYRSANPSSALYHHIVQWSSAHGHTALDMVGRVDEGISRFKMSMGATERPFVTVVSSPLPRVARSAATALWQVTHRGS